MRRLVTTSESISAPESAGKSERQTPAPRDRPTRRTDAALRADERPARAPHRCVAAARRRSTSRRRAARPPVTATPVSSLLARSSSPAPRRAASQSAHDLRHKQRRRACAHERVHQPPGVDAHHPRRRAPGRAARTRRLSRSTALWPGRSPRTDARGSGKARGSAPSRSARTSLVFACPRERRSRDSRSRYRCVRRVRGRRTRAPRRRGRSTSASNAPPRSKNAVSGAAMIIKPDAGRHREIEDHPQRA